MNEQPIMPGGSGLVERAKGILLKPADEWGKVAAESKGIGEIAMGYVLPLVLIGPIASFIGIQVFGMYGIRFGIGTGLTIAIASLVGTLVGLAVLTLIAEFLAPQFGGEANRTNAFKLCAYAGTAGWVGGIFGLLPVLAPIGLLFGLYGLYLLYLGATPLMKVPQDKSVVYIIVLVICAIVINVVVMQVVGSLMRPSLATPFA